MSYSCAWARWRRRPFSEAFMPAGAGLVRGVQPLRLRNVPSRSCRKASSSSSRVFMTIGPPQAMGSRSGGPRNGSSRGGNGVGRQGRSGSTRSSSSPSSSSSSSSSSAPRSGGQRSQRAGASGTRTMSVAQFSSGSRRGGSTSSRSRPSGCWWTDFCRGRARTRSRRVWRLVSANLACRMRRTRGSRAIWRNFCGGIRAGCRRRCCSTAGFSSRPR